MLIHLCPKLFSRVKLPSLAIAELKIAALGLHLSGEDLVVRRPFPNKCYNVACRRTGNKAIRGFLIETPERVAQFTAQIVWDLGSGDVVRHEIHYQVLDAEHDAMSESMSLWYGYDDGKIVWKNRMPKDLKHYPYIAQPTMAVVAGDLERPPEVQDQLHNNRVISRVEVFRMPTIEAERLFALGDERLPAREDAFRLG